MKASIEFPKLALRRCWTRRLLASEVSLSHRHSRRIVGGAFFVVVRVLMSRSIYGLHPAGKLRLLV
jgi:hypothetical protein